MATNAFGTLYDAISVLHISKMPFSSKPSSVAKAMNAVVASDQYPPGASSEHTGDFHMVRYGTSIWK